MTNALLHPLCVIALLLGAVQIAWLYRQLHQRRKALQALGQTVATLDAGKQQAEQANQLKGQFLGHLGHEIRTPLNAFIGLLELVLQRTAANSQNHASLQLALNAANDLRELLGDLLDISRIDSGHLQLTPAWVSLRDSVDAVVGVFQALAQKKHLNLNLEFNAPIPEPRVLIDALRFKQVLGNLLSNSIKFTHQGAIEIRLQLQPAARADYFDLQLQVLDSGIGIPEQERQRLLQPFAQADPGSQSPRDSAGLGLPISHQLCQKMGGSLSLHGRAGPGSEARVRLTLAGQMALVSAEEEPMPQVTHLPLDVLLADDHSASLMLLREQLEYLGHRVTCAEDGLQAYELWREGDFDLLIVDCNMPVMDGYQLAKAIRQSEQFELRPAVTLFGYSADHAPQALQRGLNAGMHDCLCKPLGLNLLSHKLSTLKPLPRADSFSIATLVTLTRGEPLFAQRMLNELVRCCTEDRHLLGLIPTSDPMALVTLAHKIKGSALMVGADALHAACETLEQASLDDVGIELISAAVQTLDLALVRFVQSLHRHLNHPE
ncbi:response regulator [Pseudomonas sp. Fl5BN2]|uniref:response regulator n=1 Tax=Pseudomonas sp. Fl5BN2 TaxID=2697652 RepID=UPI001378B435|nr:response regulator [Pseudomonas sp. Fl5BN2]NBF03728.1 response regulator [Pseudomonas sp. Fl5BN2]